jgi:hypothetical protein
MDDQTSIEEDSCCCDKTSTGLLVMEDGGEGEGKELIEWSSAMRFLNSTDKSAPSVSKGNKLERLGVDL